MCFSFSSYCLQMEERYRKKKRGERKTEREKQKWNGHDKIRLGVKRFSRVAETERVTI